MFFINLGYTEVITIPSGARNIYVDEMGNSKNYIGIGSAASEKFYLNGKLLVFTFLKTGKLNYKNYCFGNLFHFF